METSQNIFSYITGETNNYQSLPISVHEGYDWSMYKHIKLSLLYKCSQFETGNNDDKPFKNIIRPILNLQYRAEGFDVKDIVLFVNEQKNYYKSFLVRKYHDNWARENNIDTFIDDMVESYVDFGGALLKNVNDVKPEVIPLQRLAFCDQTDILSGAICEKHYYSPDQLKEMEEQGWGSDKNGATISIDELIDLADSYRQSEETKKQSKAPSKLIEVYELHGTFPDWWLKDAEDEGKKYSKQIHIVAYYQKEGIDGKIGVHLFKGKEKKSPYKFIARDKVFGRALGIGGIEELFEPQVWTNYSMIRIKQLLDAASKVVFQTTDDGFGMRNKVKNLKNEEILTLGEGKTISQIDTAPRNINLFNNSVQEWEVNARVTGAATESIMGEQPSSGTPFALQELVTAESHSLHEYRKGKLATFLDEVYREWIIPYIAREISKGQEFLATLEIDELESIADNVVTNEGNKAIKEKILNGELIDKEEIEVFKQEVKTVFLKNGNKRFVKILEGELKSAPIDVKVNIVGKQKYLSKIADKLVNVFRQLISNPQVLNDPRMSKIFNSIIESSGLNPIDFYQAPTQQQLQPQTVAGTPPLKSMAGQEEKLAEKVF
ncbi:MAG: hypothetical protein PHW73_02275 [Atribacterota bacterium]|nr:hypothetical protein [Atribacterota bacterium]